MGGMAGQMEQQMQSMMQQRSAGAMGDDGQWHDGRRRHGCARPSEEEGQETCASNDTQGRTTQGGERPSRNQGPVAVRPVLRHRSGEGLRAGSLLQCPAGRGGGRAEHESVRRACGGGAPAARRQMPPPRAARTEANTPPRRPKPARRPEQAKAADADPARSPVEGRGGTPPRRRSRAKDAVRRNRRLRCQAEPEKAKSTERRASRPNQRARRARGQDRPGRGQGLGTQTLTETLQPLPRSDSRDEEMPAWPTRMRSWKS